MGFPFGLSGILLGLLMGHFVDTLIERNTRSGGAENLEMVTQLFTLFGRVVGFAGGMSQSQALFLQGILQNQLPLRGAAARRVLAAFEESVAASRGRPWSEILSDTAALAKDIDSDYFLDRRSLLWTYATCRRLAALGTVRPGIVELLDTIAKAFVIFEEVGTAGTTGSRSPHEDESAWAGFKPAHEATPDAWATLGLKPGASDADLKKAYRTLVRQYHPDSHSHLPDGDPAKKKAAEQFLHVQQAYERIRKSQS